MSSWRYRFNFFLTHLLLPIDGLVIILGDVIGLKISSPIGHFSPTIVPSVRVSVGGLGGYSGAVVCRALVPVFVLPIRRTWLMHRGGVVGSGGCGAVPFCWGCVTKAVVESATL